MREKKFRAVTREGKLIYDIGSIQFFENGVIIVNDEFPVERLEEWTGLHDSTGREIYEGDIVYHDPAIDDTPYRVVWYQKRCGWWLARPNGEPYFMLSLERGELLVIGNIHETPALLEREGE